MFDTITAQRPRILCSIVDTIASNTTIPDSTGDLPKPEPRKPTRGPFTSAIQPPMDYQALCLGNKSSPKNIDQLLDELSYPQQDLSPTEILDLVVDSSQRKSRTTSTHTSTLSIPTRNVIFHRDSSRCTSAFDTPLPSCTWKTSTQPTTSTIPLQPQLKSKHTREPLRVEEVISLDDDDDDDDVVISDQVNRSRIETQVGQLVKRKTPESQLQSIDVDILRDKSHHFQAEMDQKAEDSLFREKRLLFLKKIRAKREQEEAEEKLALTTFQSHIRRLLKKIILTVAPGISLVTVLKKYQDTEDVCDMRGKEKLPLTEEDELFYTQSMSGPSTELLTKRFSITICRSDIERLQPTIWLNDEIINYYMEMIRERSRLPGYPRVHIFNSFFYDKLEKGGHASVHRWTRKVDIFSYDLVLVPINVGKVHWCISVVDIQNHGLEHYDSLYGGGEVQLKKLGDWLVAEHKAKKGTELDVATWKKKVAQDGEPHQTNSCDCGVFTCTTANWRTQPRPLTYTQADIDYFRKRMTLEILHHTLL